MNGNAVKARHLLRALLRESTYLPDSAARSYFHRYIIDRFRRYHPIEKNKHKRNGGFDNERIQHALKRARKGYSQLRRANEGELRPLSNVLYHTYGRVGRRRHELMRNLLMADAFEHGGDEAARVAFMNDPERVLPGLHKLVDPPESRDVRPFVYEVSSRFSRLRALLTSQISAQHVALRRARFKSLSVKIPSTNVWGRPLPRSRERNIVNEWVASILEKVLPPLPDDEWDRLRQLVDGERKWDGVIQRRARRLHSSDNPLAGDLSLFAATDENSVDRFLSLACRRARLPEGGSNAEKVARLARARQLITQTRDEWFIDQASREHMTDLVLEDQLELRNLNKKIGGEARPHKITAQLMRRLWAKVFSQCPKLYQDSESSKWRVLWGSWSNLYQPLQPHEPAASMFTGVDEKGKLPRPPRKPRSIENLPENMVEQTPRNDDTPQPTTQAG